MKLTQRQKIYVLVLIVAAVALLVDQVFLGGGGEPTDQAMAQPAGEPVAEAPTAVALATPAGPIGTHRRSVADRLARYVEAHAAHSAAIRDAFLPAPSWMAELSPEISDDDKARRSAEAFKQQHRLMAVLTGTGGGTAIVDNKCLRIGETLDGFSLQSVGTHSAVFVMEGERVELTLPMTGSSPPRRQAAEARPPARPSPIGQPPPMP